jgi:hypothetical protein
MNQLYYCHSVQDSYSRGESGNLVILFFSSTLAQGRAGHFNIQSNQDT